MNTTTFSDDLLPVATDYLLHGELLSRWMVDYVDLEESLAVGSIAQEEYAHAATLFSLSGMDAPQRDHFIFETSLDEWWPAQLLARSFLHDWSSTVIRGVLLSQVAIVQAEALVAAESPELRSAGLVFLAEQQLHAEHWSRWVRLLAGDRRTDDELRQRAAEVVALGADTLGTPPQTGRMDRAEQHRIWVGRVAAELSEVVDVADVLGDEPVTRHPASDYPELVELVNRMREIRLGADDGVRGLYR